MKKYAVAAAFMLALVAAAPASAIEVVDNAQASAAQMDSHPQMSAMEMATMPAPHMSELPEPEVFAMMLLGLVLIGYRARRESGEKFR